MLAPVTETEILLRIAHAFERMAEAMENQAIVANKALACQQDMADVQRSLAASSAMLEKQVRDFSNAS